jgi:hypothetical protein
MGEKRDTEKKDDKPVHATHRAYNHLDSQGHREKTDQHQDRPLLTERREANQQNAQF